jgi:hypothetical protein
VSGKIHIITDAPSYSYRGIAVKQKLLKYLQETLYECIVDNNPEFVKSYTWEQWCKYFDVDALGLRSAFSAKIKNGKVEPGVYVPVDDDFKCVDVSKWSKDDKIKCIVDYSIYAPVKSEWFCGVDYVINKVLEDGEIMKDKAKFVIKDTYNAKTNSIAFAGKRYKVCKELLYDMIDLLPRKYLKGYMWKIALQHVKAAAMLVEDFDSNYFIHTWSYSDDGYNRSGNEYIWYRAKCEYKPSESLSWLKLQAQLGMKTGEYKKK